MRKMPEVECFQGETITYTTYIRRQVITSFTPLDHLCCIIFLGFNAIIFTYQDDISSWIWYLCTIFIGFNSILSLTRMISAARFVTCTKKGVDDTEEGMIWGVGTEVFNFTPSSGLPNDSITLSPDKAGVFPYFDDVTTIFASSITSSSSDTFSPASYPSSPASDIFSLESASSSSPYDTFPPAYTPSSSLSEDSIMVFTKLPSFWCPWMTCLCLWDLWNQTSA